MPIVTLPPDETVVVRLLGGWEPYLAYLAEGGDERGTILARWCVQELEGDRWSDDKVLLGGTLLHRRICEQLWVGGWTGDSYPALAITRRGLTLAFDVSRFEASPVPRVGALDARSLEEEFFDRISDLS